MIKKTKGFLHLPFRSIRINMIFIFTILIISATFIFLGISLRVTQDSVVENSTEYTRQLVDQVNTDIDNYISYMENLATLLATNMDVREYLSNHTIDEDQKQLLNSRITTLFNTLFNMRNDIYNIVIYGENGRSIINKGNDEINPFVKVKTTDWYQKAVEAKGKRVLSSSHVQNLIRDDYKWVVTLSKAVQVKDSDKILGVAMVDLNYSSITTLCQNVYMGKMGYVFLIDESGDVIYHPKQQMVYTGIKREKIAEILSSKNDYFITELDNEKILYTMSTSPKTNWTVVGVANIDELFTKEEETRRNYLICAFLLNAVAILCAVIYSNKLTKPLTRLKDSMKEVEHGNFSGIELAQTYDASEISTLTRAYHIMINKIQNLMLGQLQAQREKRNLEIKALQSQINPHFLYNTLDSIIWMAESGKTNEVVTMTSSLSKLLRLNISIEDELVTVDTEIKSLISYLTIQKMRYQDQLNYEIEVPSSIYHYPIVKLTLQPLVENAIYHGIKYKEGMGTIIIRAWEESENIYFQIIDDGIGMDEETLEHTFDKKEKSARQNGIAIENVKRRLELYYGNEYQFLYNSKINEGTTVTIILPIKEGGQCHEK